MKPIFLTTCALVIASHLMAMADESTSPQLPPLPAGQEWRMVWNDEFDGKELDLTKWTPQGDSVRKGGMWLKKCSVLDGKGNLQLLATKEADGTYGTGCVNSKGKFEHKHGLWVARMQMPKQPGFWSAFWLMGSGVGKVGNEGMDGTEIDVIEYPKRTGELNMAVHWDGYGKEHQVRGTRYFDKSFTEGFHTYAVHWNEKEYVFYYDGKEVWRTSEGMISRVPQYIILSNEVGSWAGDIKEAKLPDQCLIDYVRVYDLEGAPPVAEKPKPATNDPLIAEELRIRDGLPNLFAKLKAGGPVRIAYLGGSITAAEGWRVKTTAWFKAQYPQAEIIEINAAISGTGSDYGACRIAADVLEKKPDLVFMEHRVNGGGGFEAKSVEGIVRQIRKANPQTDICLIYTINEGMLKDLQAGKSPRFSSIMETIANAYGIPSIDLGIEIAKREKEKTLIFKAKGWQNGNLVFSEDGTHPIEAGHAIYRDTVVRSMFAMMPNDQAKAHALPSPLEPQCWENATTVPIRKATLSAGWKPIDGEKDAIYGKNSGRTHQMLRGGVKCDQAGETITVTWNGTTLGLSDIPQGDGMELEITIDQQPPITVKRPQTDKKQPYSRFFYLPEQKPGKHTAVIRIKTLPKGTSYYAGQILVVGEVTP
jgi:beta-glucanase (GH16 family)/lysophospholipase L1-like esterase